MATLLGKDPNNFSAFDAAEYPDDLWARYFEQVYPMGQFTKEFLDKAMLFYADYFNLTLAGNDTTRALFVTGVLNEVAARFDARIANEKAQDQSKVLKFYLYSDHDDSIITLATAFKNHLPSYPPFASQIIFELWKREDSSYQVVGRMNGVNMTL